MTELNELVEVKPANIPALFVKDGCDPLLKRLHEELDKFEPDIETAKGRKEIASFANKFSKAKTLIDGHGKDLVEGEKARLKIIDAERKKFRDECDEMKKEARKPLTEWEDAEKKRVADIEEKMYTINDFIDVQLALIVTSKDAKDALNKVNAIIIDESFEEFELAATKAKAAALTQLEAKFIVLQNAEKEKAEAERVEKERLEKEQKDREKKIAKEAAEKATREAKAKTKEKDAKAKQAVIDAKAATEKAKRETKEAEDRAEREKKEAADQAGRDREAAVEKEKKRQADQIKADKEADEKRQANKRHRGKINREAKASFIDANYSEAEAEKIIELIAKGKIANITINY